MGGSCIFFFFPITTGTRLITGWRQTDVYYRRCVVRPPDTTEHNNNIIVARGGGGPRTRSRPVTTPRPTRHRVFKLITLIRSYYHYRSAAVSRRVPVLMISRSIPTVPRYRSISFLFSIEQHAFGPPDAVLYNSSFSINGLRPHNY